MKQKEMNYLIANCLAIDTFSESKERIKKLINPNTNWDQFVSQCSNHLVLQTVYVKFRDNDLLKFLPPELSEYLAEIYELNLKRNNSILLQINEINLALNHQNIHPVYLKGAGNLIDNLYKDKGERIMSDIDILVEEDNFMNAAEILEGIGYSNNFPVYEDYSKMMHYPTLFREGSPAVIEIHRSPVLLKWSEGLNAEMVLRDKKEISENMMYYVPSDRHKVLINFIHSQLSNRANTSGLVSLRDLYDLFLLSEKVEINKVLEGFPYKRSLNAYLFLAENLFGKNTGLQSNKSFSSRIYFLHFNLNLSSRIYYKSFKFLYGLYILIIERYIGSVFSFIFSSSFRKTALKKTSSKEWYKNHFSSLRDRFN
jgi:hypothetical protein